MTVNAPGNARATDKASKERGLSTAGGRASYGNTSGGKTAPSGVQTNPTDRIQPSPFGPGFSIPSNDPSLTSGKPTLRDLGMAPPAPFSPSPTGRPTAGGSGAPANIPGVDPATIQQQGGRVVLDPVTGEPIGTMPEGQLTIGGPARAYPENSDTNTAQALAAHGLAPAGSTELGNAINSQHYYTDAMKKQNEPGFGGWARRNLSLMGLEQAPVRLDQPATYAEGTPHLGLNPPGLIGGLAGGALGFPGLGPAAGAAFTAAGGRDLVLSGGQAFDPQTGQPAAPPASRSLPPGFRASGANGAQVPSSTPSATVPSGASQPVQQTPAASPGTSQQTGGPAPAYGQKSGGTIITGSNTVAWPWSQVNA